MRTRLEVFTEIQEVDSRAAELKDKIATAKARAYRDRSYVRADIFAEWQRDLNDLKRRRQMLQFEMGEINRAERRQAQQESDRIFAEKISAGATR
jgi:hypothetical protein